MKPETAIRAIRLIHTLIWAFFAACVLAIPVYSHAGDFLVSTLLIATVAVEVLVLALNRGSCPLTGVAARYTDDRQNNFDIYLPEWLAKYNKSIFGPLYVLGVLYTLLQWS